MMGNIRFPLEETCRRCTDVLVEWKCDQDLFDRVMTRSGPDNEWRTNKYAYRGRVCLPCFVAIALKLNSEESIKHGSLYFNDRLKIYECGFTGPFVVNYNDMTIRKGYLSESHN